jgi:hypothetical protein
VKDKDLLLYNYNTFGQVEGISSPGSTLSIGFDELTHNPNGFVLENANFGSGSTEY